MPEQLIFVLILVGVCVLQVLNIRESRRQIAAWRRVHEAQEREQAARCRIEATAARTANLQRRRGA